ncbi:unnamed protein product, partial [marine sediment metagenome]
MGAITGKGTDAEGAERCARTIVDLAQRRGIKLIS